MRNNVDLSAVKTCDIVAELRRREGVETYIAGPYEDVQVSANGPTILVLVTD